MVDRLVRSRHDKMIAGVCGGLGAYLRLDPAVVRVFFVLLALGDGIGVLLYLILWLVMPAESHLRQAPSAGQGMSDRARSMREELREAAQNPDPRAATIVGAALILVGAFTLLRRLNLAWLAWLDMDLLWPLLLIVAGVMLLARRLQGGSAPD
jgi:phage shock protein C